MKKIAEAGYRPLLVAIKERIRKAQHLALQAVNRELIALYSPNTYQFHRR